MSPTPRHAAVFEEGTEFRLVRFACGDDELEPWARRFLAPEPIDADEALRDLRRLGEGWRVVLVDPDDIPPEATDALVVERQQVTPSLVGAVPGLAGVIKFGSDLSTIDQSVRAQRDIDVFYIARRTTAHVAEHTLMLMLVLCRRLLQGGLVARRSTTERGGASGPAEQSGHPPTVFNWQGVMGIRALRQRRLVVMGPGEIGTAVMRRAAAFGMRVRYWGRHSHPEVDAEIGASRIALSDVPGWADVVSLHLPYSQQLEHIVDEAFLEELGPEGLLINTSRGRLVDEEALNAALRDGRLGGAGLDVFGTEPPPSDDPLHDAPNVVLTPHVAAGTRGVVLEDVREILSVLETVT